jgi:hypothetical protein
MNGLYALISKMLEKIYNDGNRILGDIVHEARCEMIQEYFPIQSMYGPAVIYVTLGDPALRLRYPFSPGTGENIISPAHNDTYSASIVKGPIIFPEGYDCQLFDITGRQIHTLNPAPGIYFIEIDGVISHKVIKIK